MGEGSKMIKSINRKPTDKDKTKAMNVHSGKRKYSWNYKGNDKDWHIWGSSGNGGNLWEALIDDAQGDSSQHSSIFTQWTQNMGTANCKDEELRDEYMCKHLYSVYVVIGTKDRKILIETVRAGNCKQAIDKKRQDIGAEFLGQKYRIAAEHTKPDIDEEEFEKMCYDRAYEECDDIENCIDDKEKDKDVADFFGISFEIDSWDCDNVECCEIDDVRAVCTCGYPLTGSDLWDEVRNTKDDIPECGNCGKDVRTAEEMVVDGI